MIKTLTALSALCILALTTTLSVPLASCTKEIIVRDTITLKDTVTIKDTVTVIDSSNCYSCYDLKEGLVAYYNFNNGTLNDSSGNNNHISVSNATRTSDRSGKENNAYLFDGNSTYMRVPHHSSLNTKEITLYARVKAKDFYVGPCSINNIFSKGAPDPVGGYFALRIGNYDGGCHLPTDKNRERFSGAIQNTGINSDTFFVKPDIWYDVAFTYDGSTSRLYVNGQLKTETAVSSNIMFNSQDVYIGKHGDATFPYWFNGIMDDIKIYNRALCLGEVKALYNSKK